jgi:hypothetical protein
VWEFRAKVQEIDASTPVMALSGTDSELRVRPPRDTESRDNVLT